MMLMLGILEAFIPGPIPDVQVLYIQGRADAHNLCKPCVLKATCRLLIILNAM